MATYTTNYNLERPDASDPFGDFRESYNDNLDIIDANLGGGGGSSSLAGLSDVNLTTPTDGQVLTYDNVNSEWVNANPSGGGDSVSWTQLQASGTKIAEIDINGTTQDVYAPSGGGGGGSVDYSTTEQTIGTWINGNPLYQITIQTTAGNSTNTENTIWSFSGIDIVNVCQIRAEWDTDSYIFVNCQDDLYIYTYPNRMVEVHHSNDYNGTNIIFTVQYTKNSD